MDARPGHRVPRVAPRRRRGKRLPAAGQYRPSGPGGRFEPWALQVLETSGGKITGLNAFLDVERYFPLFGLPDRLEP